VPRGYHCKKFHPETDKENINRELDISKEKIGSNVLDAISRGTRWIKAGCKM
jgi:hypothetical protein